MRVMISAAIARVIVAHGARVVKKEGIFEDAPAAWMGLDPQALEAQQDCVCLAQVTEWIVNLQQIG